MRYNYVNNKGLSCRYFPQRIEDGSVCHRNFLEAGDYFLTIGLNYVVSNDKITHKTYYIK
jgi:hypothetical protein